jgi:hypothetical protein
MRVAALLFLGGVIGGIAGVVAGSYFWGAILFVLSLVGSRGLALVHLYRNAALTRDDQLEWGRLFRTGLVGIVASFAYLLRADRRLHRKKRSAR